MRHPDAVLEHKKKKQKNYLILSQNFNKVLP